MLKIVLKTLAVGLLVGLLSGLFEFGFLSLCGLDIFAKACGGVVMLVIGFAIGAGGYSTMSYEEAVFKYGVSVAEEPGQITRRLRPK